MDMRLYPRPVPAMRADQTAGDRLHIWIGVFGVTTPPPIQWFLNGAPITPTTLVALHSVRSAELVPSTPPRAFTGVYEFAGLQPESSYNVKVQSGIQQASIAVRTLPVIRSSLMFADGTSGVAVWTAGNEAVSSEVSSIEA